MPTNYVLMFQQHHIGLMKMLTQSITIHTSVVTMQLFFFFALTYQYCVKGKLWYLSNVFQTVTEDKS